MQKNVLEYVEKTAKIFPNKIAFRDNGNVITFTRVMSEAKKTAGAICRVSPAKEPVIVLADKSIEVICMYLGIAYAGCFYIALGTDMPAQRMQAIIADTNAKVMITAGDTQELIDSLAFCGMVIRYEDIAAGADQRELAQRFSQSLDTDPLLVTFTSGSSGRPKGVVLSHRSVIDYIDIFAQTFGITDKDILGNQSPLDYIAAIRDIYLPLCTGAETVLISRRMFLTPYKLFEYINSYKINMLCWAASALELCARLKTFDKINLSTVEKVFFTGSVIPNVHLRIWQEHLPDALFINHYGPTEITASCTYYILKEKISESDELPIGIPFENTGIILLDENDHPVLPGREGEICVSGAGLALGYYNDAERTKEAFIQNPLVSTYSERIYKTGDLGIWRSDGNLIFRGRRDFQFKHMGHRIEPKEIELAACRKETVGQCACLYQQETQQIFLFYTGECEPRELAVHLSGSIMEFMMPKRYIKLDVMPAADNGKIDYEELKGRFDQ